MQTMTFHEAAHSGDLQAMGSLLDRNGHEALNAYDAVGLTPLMCAVLSDRADAEVCRFLLDRGADVEAVALSRATGRHGRTVVSLALSAGDPAKVALLLDTGARLDYSRDGYGPLLDALHGRDVTVDDRLLDLLRMLVANGVALDGITSYGESGLRVLSRLGRFDGVALLLQAGANESQLEWTPLIKAVATGTLEDVEHVLEAAPALEERDVWQRTAWLVAVLTGDVAKAKCLLDHGADRAARGRCGQPAPLYAMQAHHMAMLRWLLDIGISIECTDDFGTTPLIAAAEHGNVDAIDLLLEAGAERDAEGNSGSALAHANDAATAKRLLDAGCDPGALPFEVRRGLLGLVPEPSEALLSVSREDFLRGWRRRFGTSNPEEMAEPFWRGMVRSGVNGYLGARHLGQHGDVRDGPVWCAQRFGQSITFLPDGRIIQVGGEHEDSYDPDFCIYNDVFVHGPDASFRIYGYPEADFPPTDFHTATLVGDSIWLIGSLGYPAHRRHDVTPVYRLDTCSLRIERIEVTGSAPGWIYQHRAVFVSPKEIVVSGGKTVEPVDGTAQHASNAASYALDIAQLRWRRIE